MHRLILIAALAALSFPALADEAPEATAAADTTLCDSTPRRTAPDMRIEESHLDQAAARAATEAFCTWLADEGFWHD